MKSLVALSALALLTACASAPPVAGGADPSAPGQAQLTLLRPDGAPYLGLDARVDIDGRRVAAVPTRGVATVAVAPGTRRVRVDTAGAPGACTVTVDLQAGETRHLEIGPRAGARAHGVPFTTPAVTLAAMLFQLGAMSADAAGKDCGGPFALTALDDGAARQRIAALAPAATTPAR